MPAEYWDLNLQPEPMWLTLLTGIALPRPFPSWNDVAFLPTQIREQLGKPIVPIQKDSQMYLKNHCLPYTNLCGECCLLTLAPQETHAVPALG